MKRVMIVGQPGSGKSTLAIRLGQAEIYENHPDNLRAIRLTTQWEIDAFLEDASRKF